jgi:hypothetical protein
MHLNRALVFCMFYLSEKLVSLPGVKGNDRGIIVKTHIRDIIDVE